MKNKNNKTTAGFTLVELILYVGIASVILLVISLFLATVLESRVKNQTIAEVDQVATQAIQIITQTIRNSDSINSPLAGQSSETLSLKLSDLSKNPTNFDLAFGSIRIIEGTAQPVPITGPQVIVSNLSFQNLSRPDTVGLVRIQFTLTYASSSGRNEMDYTKDFYTSASLR